MPLIRQVGITPQELDELVDEERWRQWCLAEPDLAEIGSLKAVRELRGEAEDQALGALLRLAATDGHDDQLAAVAVLHQLGGSVRTIARHFWHLAGGDVEGIVVGAVWEQIRSYDWRSRPASSRLGDPPRHQEGRPRNADAGHLKDVRAQGRAPESTVLGVRAARGA